MKMFSQKLKAKEEKKIAAVKPIRMWWETIIEE